MLDTGKTGTDSKTFRELIIQHRQALIASVAFMFMMIVSNQVEEEVILIPTSSKPTRAENICRNSMATQSK